MASFDLKPQDATNKAMPPIAQMMWRPGDAIAKAVPSAEEIVWTLPRSPVPPQLEGRVTDGMWAATWDRVQQKVVADTERQKEYMVKQFGNMPMCPCCLCCLACKQVSLVQELQQMSHDMEQAWLSLAAAEHERWAPYGVAVTIAHEVRVAGTSHGANSTQVKVGLTFSLGQGAAPSAPSAPLAYAAPAPFAPPVAAGGGGGIGSELEKLNRLRLDGALSEAEFAAAKAKLLGGR